MVSLSDDSRAHVELPCRAGALELLSWSIGPGIQEDESMRHTLSVCLHNTGTSTLALCAARCVVKGSDGERIANVLLHGESLNARETRWLISDFSIPADGGKSPRGTVASLNIGTTETATVVSLPEQAVTPATFEHEHEQPPEAEDNADHFADASIPSQYEPSSVEAKLSTAIWDTYEDGWNSEGVPATFEFPDGVLLRYWELDLEDPDLFAGSYDRMTGYKAYADIDARALHAEGLKSGSPWLFQFTLDFSTHPDLEASSEELTVAINELQAGGDGPIAGSIIFGDDIDRDWLAQWVDCAIEEGWKVERL
jgi:hypothetical protein